MHKKSVKPSCPAKSGDTVCGGMIVGIRMTSPKSYVCASCGTCYEEVTRKVELEGCSIDITYVDVKWRNNSGSYS